MATLRVYAHKNGTTQLNASHHAIRMEIANVELLLFYDYRSRHVTIKKYNGQTVPDKFISTTHLCLGHKNVLSYAIVV